MTYDWEGVRTRRVKRLAMICAAIMVSTIAVLVSAATYAHAQSMLMVTGKCQKLIVGKKDFTAHCQGKVLSSAFSSGRIGFYFLIGNKAVLTISGMDLPNPTSQTDATKVDKIIFNLGTKGVPSTESRASGKCSYANPARPMTIRCQGAMEDGSTFTAIFRTDGRPPS